MNSFLVLLKITNALVSIFFQLIGAWSFGRWLRGWSDRREKSIVKPEKIPPQIDTFGFYQCPNCHKDYLFTSVFEFENLLDRHNCKKVTT
jgi:hypothetical protein